MSLIFSILILSVLAAAVFVVVERVCVAISKKRFVALQKECEELKDEVENALEDVSSKYNFNHYVTESEREDLARRYMSLYHRLRTITRQKTLSKISGTESFSRLYNALSDTSGFKKINNDKFIASQLDKNKEYFDTILTYPLDAQQREAIVSLEDNVLVISSAGSGKTMTTVGKVRYLIDKQGIDPKKILLITFTRKAAASLSERLGENDLKCLTFHKLALDIIAEATGAKPSMTDGNFAASIYHQLMDNDEAFHHAIADYVLRARYKMKSQFDFGTMDEYIQSRQEKAIQAFYNDMDGKPIFCKSDEESQICDWLGERNIKFRYEEKYEYDTQDPDHRQYMPDFSIYFKDTSGVQKRIYLEHYAVNEYGHVPNWFGDGTDYSHQLAEAKYLQGIEWKRNLHHEKGTILIETRSADFHNGTISDVLSAQLKAHGYIEPTKKIRNNNISRELEQQEQSILDMLTAFTFLLKSKGLNSGQIESLGIETQDALTVNQIIKPFIAAYEKEQAQRNEIDFVDAIVQATEICNKGQRHEYDYILVDEFQDISMDRYRFLQALRTQSPLTKLFCVGDDWQSIYRFAGSDMSLFKDFSKYFGYTKECRMETTYRFGEPLIQKSSEFILHNPDQKSKDVKAFNDSINTKLEFIAVNDRDDVIQKFIELIKSIPVDKDIYVLGRYSFNVNIFKGSPVTVKNNTSKVTLSYEGREMTYMTVHQSKGLESDYVILLGCDSGNLGFPSEIGDAPVLKYVLSRPDGYRFGEERRVFYVGITRAKKVTYIFYNKEKPSTFIPEFIHIDTPAPKIYKEEIPAEQLCPRCHCGRIIEMRRGKAVNGNPYTFYICSNERLGCDYKETRFVNIHKAYPRRRR